MKEKKQSENYDHNRDVLLRYVSLTVLILFGLSFFLFSFFHLYKLSSILVKIAVVVAFFPGLFIVVSRFMPSRFRLPGKPVSLIENLVYVFVFAFLLLGSLIIKYCYM